MACVALAVLELRQILLIDITLMSANVRQSGKPGAIILMKQAFGCKKQQIKWKIDPLLLY